MGLVLTSTHSPFVIRVKTQRTGHVLLTAHTICHVSKNPRTNGTCANQYTLTICHVSKKKGGGDSC